MGTCSVTRDACACGKYCVLCTQIQYGAPGDHTPASTGLKTAYIQQNPGISAKLRSSNNHSTPNAPRQLILDLQACLKHLIAEEHMKILSMDSNEDLNSSICQFTPLTYDPDTVTHCAHYDGSLSTLIETCGLLDIIQVHHMGKAPPTYNRGKHHLDYIFISSNLSPTILWLGILLFTLYF
jgi:hypothetical protein